MLSGVTGMRRGRLRAVRWAAAWVFVVFSFHAARAQGQEELERQGQVEAQAEEQASAAGANAGEATASEAAASDAPPEPSNEPSVDELIEDGAEAFRSGEYPLAQSAFAAAVEKAPQYPRALALLALSHFVLGEFDDGGEVIQHALNLSPNAGGELFRLYEVARDYKLLAHRAADLNERVDEVAEPDSRHELLRAYIYRGCGYATVSEQALERMLARDATLGPVRESAANLLRARLNTGPWVSLPLPVWYDGRTPFADLRSDPAGVAEGEGDGWGAQSRELAEGEVYPRIISFGFEMGSQFVTGNLGHQLSPGLAFRFTLALHLFDAWQVVLAYENQDYEARRYINVDSENVLLVAAPGDKFDSSVFAVEVGYKPWMWKFIETNVFVGGRITTIDYVPPSVARQGYAFGGGPMVGASLDAVWRTEPLDVVGGIVGRGTYYFMSDATDLDLSGFAFSGMARLMLRF